MLISKKNSATNTTSPGQWADCKLQQRNRVAAGPGRSDCLTPSKSFIRQKQNTEHKMADNVAGELDKMKIEEGKEVRYFC